MAALESGGETSIRQSEYSGTLDEDSWSKIALPAGASYTAYVLGGMSDPEVIALFGGGGVWMSLSATGDKLYADPFAILSYESSGLGVATIYLGNDDAQEHDVYLIAFE